MATVNDNALIGYTGFVGGGLLRDRPLGAIFNSKNIGDMRGRSFDTVVCAGVSAVKWLANKEPENDWQGIARLLDGLEGVTAQRFVLISSIDVYRNPSGQTERDVPETDGLHPYGLHRLKLESIIRDRFPVCNVVRLPALFGTGLRKNAIYDMMNLNQPEKVIPNASFQWYPTWRLASDLDRIVASEVALINITTEPVTMSSINDRFFPDVSIGAPVPNPPRYDLHTAYSEILGGTGPYHLSSGQVLDS
jgi:hypothetical protein